jgi:hypothetical protein
MIVEIFIPQSEAVNALAQQVHLTVGNLFGSAGIRQCCIQRLDQVEPTVDRAQEHDSAVTGDVTPGKIRRDFPPIKAWKAQFSLRTLWH